jgi:hypothetical protein
MVTAIGHAEHEKKFLEKENIPNVLHAKWQQKLPTGLPCFALEQKSACWHIHHEFARKIIVVLHETTCLLALPTKAKILVFRFIIECSSL